MLKRILAFLMVIMIFMLNTVSVPAQEYPQDILKTEYEEAVTKLIAVGVIDKSEDGFYPLRDITRAEYTAMILRLVGEEEQTVLYENTVSRFKDVRNDAWYMPYIELAAELGFVDGVGNGYFEPQETVTYGSAVKLLLSIMGYKNAAEQNGGFVKGYMMIASKLGVSLKKNADDTITRGEAALLMDMALTANSLTVKYETDEKIEIEYEPLSEKKLDIYCDKGIVTANGRTSISSLQVKEGEIAVDNDIVLNIGETNADKLLGCHVEYYWRENESTGEKNLLYIKKTSKNRELYIKADDDITLFQNTLTYVDNGRNKNVSVPKDADIVYNEKQITSLPHSGFNVESGDVTLIDNGSGDWNTVIINSYTNMVVSSVRVYDGTVFGEFSSAQSVKLDEKTTDFDIFDINENKLELSDIKAGDVLSIFESMNGEYIKVIVSDESVEAEIESILSEDGSIITTNGEKYTIQSIWKNYADENNISVNAGDAVLLYTDHLGKVCNIKNKTNKNTLIGYIIKPILDEDEDNAKLKIFTEKKEIRVYDFADTVSVDQNVKKTPEAVVSALNTENVKNYGLVCFTLNSEDKIRSVDTAAVDVESRESENSLFLAYTGYKIEDGSHKQGTEKMLYKTRAKSSGFKILMNDNTPIFRIPAENIDEADEKIFDILDISELLNDGAYYFDSYQLNKNAMVTDALVMYSNTKSSGSVDGESNVAIVKNISTVYDEEYGEVRTKITALFEGKEIELIADDDTTFCDVKGIDTSYVYKNMHVGDVFRFRRFANGRVSTVEMILGTKYERTGENENTDINQKEFAGSSVDDRSKLYEISRFCLKKVYAKHDGNIRVAYEPLSDIASSEVYNLETHRASAYRIYVIDMENPNKIEIRNGSINDIISYEESETDYSQVLIHSRYGEPRTIVVINE